MAQKTKTREIFIVDKGGSFKILPRKIKGKKEDYNFEGLSAIRHLLSNEKARLLHTIKSKNPGSIYELAKILKRDFKSVHADIQLLDRFGFIDMVEEQTGKRKKLKPVLTVDSIHVVIKV